MLTLSRALLRRLRIAFGRGVGVSAKQTGPPVRIEGGEHGVTFRAHTDDVAIEYRLTGAAGGGVINAPLELLRRCEGTKASETVALRQEHGSVLAEWQDGSMPMTAELPVVEDIDEFPPLPDNFIPNPPALLDALRDAALTTAGDSTRFALDHIRLRGITGQIAASDSRQMLVQHSFGFPWQDDRLVHANRLLSSGDLRTGELVEVGCKADFVVFGSGPWAIWLRHADTLRFPDIDDFLRPVRAKATMHVAEPDAAFLADAVPKLPCHDGLNKPVSVDLNGAVAVRAGATAEQKVTEVVLSQSHREGKAIRFATNRDYLVRAVKLGFRSISVSAADAPIRCHEPTRDYVWATLGKDSIVKREPDTVRIESPPASQEKHTSQSRKEPEHSMPQNNSTEQEQQSASELIDAAELLKTSLRESLTAVATLIAGLKRHRQQNKKIRSAVASLKQLQAIDA